MEEITWSNDDSEVPKREMIMTNLMGTVKGLHASLSYVHDSIYVGVLYSTTRPDSQCLASKEISDHQPMRNAARFPSKVLSLGTNQRGPKL